MSGSSTATTAARSPPARSWSGSARCEVVVCDEDAARRINIVDNRAADLGTYDFETLADLLAGLDDLEGTGYTPRDVEDITALLTAPPDEVTDLAEHHGEPNEDVFRPKINMAVDPETFDRWRVALDAHRVEEGAGSPVVPILPRDGFTLE
ncbi:hypothetical protein [Streptomyces hydrogenans]|uniref:hypothetical protein n=1 Tax=Streptomyces hydrogenans TaxID=1873719 RepID=UPI0035E2DAE2